MLDPAHSRLVVLASLAILTAGAIANAQSVRGIVVDGGDRPLAGVVVFMLDSSSSIVARALTDERGAFRVATSHAGRYRLRTMRIGYRAATSAPIALFVGGEVEQQIRLSGVQVALDTVMVVDRSSCRVTSDDNAVATLTVLDQARTALSAAQLSLSGRTVRATTTSYDRLLDAGGRRVSQQSSRTTTAYVRQPWQAISPDRSHRAGFVSFGNDNSITYNAPSIDVLVSSAFVEDHCFRIVTDGRSDLIGVAFEPSPARKKIPEIKGTLWLNRQSAELQGLDYRYVNITSAQEDAGAGGEVAFARMKDGGWVISRWNIRMPILSK